MNTVPTPTRLPPPEAQALEARFGLRVAAHLQMSSEELPHDIGERLRVARQQAVARARQATRQQTAAVGASAASALQVVGVDPHNGTAMMMGSGDDRDEAWWMRLGILIPLLMLVAGLVGIDWWHTNEQIQATAEIDAALLGDDLPPAAYADPGFAEYIVAPQARAE